MKERLKQILRDKDLTQVELATRAGIAPATITHFFNDRNNLSDEVVSKILLAYPDIDPVWFWTGKGEKYMKIKEELPLFNDETARKERQMQQPFQYPMPNNMRERVEFQEEKVVNTQIPVAPASPVSQTVQKQVDKIVFFYVDKTFETYYPQ